MTMPQTPVSTGAYDAYAIPIDKIDVSDPMLYHHHAFDPFFRRLRAEDPVHYCAESPYGPYWSVTRYADILAIDTNHRSFSSANQAIVLNEKRLTGDVEGATPTGGIINMDPPKHDIQRKIFSPAVAPSNLLRLEAVLRERTVNLLRELPVGEEFDWVQKVSIELTLLMLATLIDYPYEDRARLKKWSDMVTGSPGDGNVLSWEQKDREIKEMAAALLDMLDARRKLPPQPDVISMLAHSPAAAEMSTADYIANMSLLIVGGNETTRNSMSGSIIAFNDFPDQWDKLMANPELLTSTIPEILRWQTPLMVQGRRAMEDYEIGGKTIRKGDKVLMWYISGNRDETIIADPYSFIIDRERARQHLSFGFGIHRCLGNRLAEMQLRVLWEEIIRMNWKRIEVTGTPVYAISHSLHAIEKLPVRIHA